MNRLSASAVPLLLLLPALAAGALAQDGGSTATRGLGSLLEQLDDPNPAIRIEAVDELGRRRSLTVLLRLIGALRDDVADVRSHAAEALRNFGDERAVPYLSRALEDANANVRCRAVLALGTLAGKYVLPAVKRMLEDPAIIVRAAAVRALGEIGDPLSLGDILNVRRAPASDPDRTIESATVIAAARLGGPKGLSRALDVVGGDLAVSWFLRASVAHAAGLAGDRDRTSMVRGFLFDDPNPRVAQAAAGALGALGAEKALLAALELKAAFRRQAAVGALANLDSPAAREAVVRATRDESPGVVLSAAAVLVGRGEKEALPILVGLLEAKAQIWLGALTILEVRTGMDFGRNPPRWRTWLEENRELLVFDPESGRFAVPR